MIITKKLKARPKTWLSRDYLVHEGTQQVALLSASVFRRNAKALIGETEYELDREAAFSGKFFIKLDDSLFATADPKSLFRHSYIVTCGDTQYTFRLTSFLRGSFGLFEKDKEIGSIARESFFSKTTILKFPTNFALPSAVFLYWLVLLSRRRRSRMRH